MPGWRTPASLLVLAGMLAAGACSDSGGAAPATTVATTTSTTVASSTTTTTAATVSTVATAGTTAGGDGDCHGIQVEAPAIIALSPTDGSPCWSALSNWNAHLTLVADGRLVVVGSPCPIDESDPFTVAVLDAATGSEVWRRPMRSEGARPVLGAGLGILVPPADGRVEALDLATGQVLWTRDGATVVGDGPDTVIVTLAGQDTTAVAALDRRTGEPRWTAPVPGHLYAGATADASVVAVGEEGGTVLYDARTGERLRQLPIRGSDLYGIALVDGVAIGAELVGLSTTAYDTATGQKLWTNPGYLVERPEPVNGNVFVGLDAGIAALDPRTGAVRWTVEGSEIAAGPGLVTTAPMPGMAAALEVIDPATGQVRWSKPLAELDLPSPDTVTPAGFTLAYQHVLPSSSGIFFAYGNCLGN